MDLLNKLFYLSVWSSEHRQDSIALYQAKCPIKNSFYGSFFLGNSFTNLGV